MAQMEDRTLGFSLELSEAVVLAHSVLALEAGAAHDTSVEVHKGNHRADNTDVEVSHMGTV